MKQRILRALVCACLLVGSATHLQAATVDVANRAFADGRFGEAAVAYKQVIREEGYSAPVLYNLGNAYLRDGRVGLAILNYERARVLAPNDADIAANLKSARKKAGLFAEQRWWARDAAEFFTMNGWAWLGTAALVALCASIVSAQLYPSRRLYMRIASGVAGVTLIAAVAALVLQLDTLRLGVVTAKEAVARVSPFDSAKSAFVLSAGEVVSLDKAHDDFILVKNHENRTGWVSKAQVEAVVPAQSS